MPSVLDNGTFMCFMAIALAGLGVCMAYAIFSRFTPKPAQNNANDEFSQAQYMREVRLRYQGSMANANGYGRKWLQITQDQTAAQGGGYRGHGSYGGSRESEGSYV